MDPRTLELLCTYPLLTYVILMYAATRRASSRGGAKTAHSAGNTVLNFAAFAIFFCTLIRILFFAQQLQDIRKYPPRYHVVALVASSLTWLLHFNSAVSLAAVGFWIASCAVTAYEFAERRRYLMDYEESWAGNSWTLGLLSLRGVLQLMLLTSGLFAYRQLLVSRQGYRPLPDTTVDEEEDVSPAPASSANIEAGRVDPKLNQRITFSVYLRRLRTLLPFMWPKGDRTLQACIIASFMLLGAGRVVNMLVPNQYSRLIDSLGGDGKGYKAEAIAELLWFVGLRALQGGVGLISTVQSLFWIPAGQFTTRSVSVSMFEHLHNLSLRFHLNRKTGEILRVQDRGVNSIVSLLQSIVFQIFPTLVDIVVACIYIAWKFDLYFASIVLVTMALYIYATIVVTDWRVRYRREANDAENAMEARAVDSLLNFETVKYYGAEKFEVSRYDEALRTYQKAEWRSQATLYVLNSVQNLTIQLGLLVGCLVLVDRVRRGEMTIGQVVLYLAYITQLYGPLNFFGTFYRQTQRNFVDMEKMLDLFQEHVEIQDAPNAAPLAINDGSVTFDKVSFAYDARQPILRNVSFHIPGGQTYAIVGPSGAGKSTILRLLFRFYDMQQGRILIDGQDIRQVPQTDLRQSIGVVPQDTVLFNDSIGYNIHYGKVTAPWQDVEKAAIAAQIHSKIVGFPDGYETKVGERGLRLSGGEKQRVCISRTILKNPKVVLLDEATSALDTNTERQIQAALREMTVDRTTLIIAHRLSTVIHAHRILVLHDGEVVEAGTHAELMGNADGIYYDMWMKQLQEEGEKDSEAPVVDK